MQSSKNLNNFDLESALYPSSHNKHARPTSHHDATKYLHMRELAVIVREEGSSDGVPAEASNSGAKKDRTVTDADFSDG